MIQATQPTEQGVVELVPTFRWCTTWGLLASLQLDYSWTPRVNREYMSENPLDACVPERFPVVPLQDEGPQKFWPPPIAVRPPKRRRVAEDVQNVLLEDEGPEEAAEGPLLLEALGAQEKVGDLAAGGDGPVAREWVEQMRRWGDQMEDAVRVRREAEGQGSDRDSVAHGSSNGGSDDSSTSSTGSSSSSLEAFPNTPIFELCSMIMNGDTACTKVHVHLHLSCYTS